MQDLGQEGILNAPEDLLGWPVPAAGITAFAWRPSAATENETAFDGKPHASAPHAGAAAHRQNGVDYLRAMQQDD